MIFGNEIDMTNVLLSCCKAHIGIMCFEYKREYKICVDRKIAAVMPKAIILEWVIGQMGNKPGGSKPAQICSDHVRFIPS